MHIDTSATLVDVELLVTGFGPFGDNAENPSAWLAEQSMASFEILEVSFRAVDQFVEGLSKNPPQALLCIGLAQKARVMRLETVAHNWIGPTPDVLGEVWGPGPIDPRLPSQLSSTLWTAEDFLMLDEAEPSADAGGYLCNYLLFKAIRALPTSQVAFLHVPPFAVLEQTRQLAALQTLLTGRKLKPSLAA